jgi:hypothetical protein
VSPVTRVLNHTAIGLKRPEHDLDHNTCQQT